MNMSFSLFSLLYSLGLLIGMLGCLKIGHAIGRKRLTRGKNADEDDDEGSALDGVVFALLGLLLAFSFSAALGSYTAHRDLLTREANNIAEVYTKLDLLPLEDQAPLRVLVRQYANTRLEATAAPLGSSTEQDALQRSQQLQEQIWEHIAKFVKTSNNPAISGQIIDAYETITNDASEQLAKQADRVPIIIYILIMVLSMMSSLVAGYGMSDHRKLPIIRVIIFALAIVMTMYVILDLEHPRVGFFNSAIGNPMLQKTISQMH